MKQKQPFTGVRKKAVLNYFAKFLGRFEPETPTQVLSCEFLLIFYNSFFAENLRATASKEGRVFTHLLK